MLKPLTVRDLVTLTFDLLTLSLSYMAGHMTNITTKFEDPKTIRSWVTSYNVSHWLPLKMRTRPLRMRRITWPVSRGSKAITYLESPTPICLSLYNFYWTTTTIKDRLLSCHPMLKPFSGEKIQSRQNGPNMAVFWGKWGSKPEILVSRPQKALPCAEPRRLTYFASKSVRASQGPKKVAESLCAEGREITHAQNRNP